MGSSLPDDYGTPEYESRWIREKLKLPPDAKTSELQGAMHVQEMHARGYEMYIASHKCEHKQGEIARLTVENARLRRQVERLGVKIDALAGMCQEFYGVGTPLSMRDELWQGSKAKQRVDAILADEPGETE